MPSGTFSSELARVTEVDQPFLDRLYSSDSQVFFKTVNISKLIKIKVQWEAVNDIRNLIVGNKRQKANFIIIGAVPREGWILKLLFHLKFLLAETPNTVNQFFSTLRLVYMLKSEECSTCVKRDCVTLLTSLAKGGGDSVISLCDYGACEAVLLGILLSKFKKQKINSMNFEDKFIPLKVRFTILSVTSSHSGSPSICACYFVFFWPKKSS